MTQTPDQPLSEDWVYIEHPEAGRSENPIPRASLDTWLSNGWREASTESTQSTSQQSGPVPGAAPASNPQQQQPAPQAVKE